MLQAPLVKLVLVLKYLVYLHILCHKFNLLCEPSFEQRYKPQKVSWIQSVSLFGQLLSFGSLWCL